MRIPTILALLIIILGLGIGIAYFYTTQKNATPPKTAIPQNIQIVNTTDSGATVIWETNEPSAGYVSYGESSHLGSIENDIRDTKDPTPHTVHFVILTDLTPQTLYYFKVRSGPYFYPQNDLTFKTAKTLPENSSTETETNNKAVAGVVLDTNLSPVDEALVLLHISGAAPIATITSKAGNFLLSTAYLYTDNLQESFSLQKKTPAQLVVKRLDLESHIAVSLPIEGNLPKIILGQDSDFSHIIPSSESAALTQEATPSSTTSCKPNFDLNKDKKVNAVDLTILLGGIGLKSSDKNFPKQDDFNCDGVVDQKDVLLLKKSLTQ